VVVAWSRKVTGSDCRRPKPGRRFATWHRVVRKWRDRFAASGVSRKDIEYIAPAMLSSSFLSEEAPQAASWHRVLLLIQTSPPSLSRLGKDGFPQPAASSSIRWKVCLRHG